MKTILKDRSNCLIIAEAGVNHNGEKSKAFDLIDMAVKAGADAIKFQTFTAEKVANIHAPKAAYQKTNTGSDESQLEMLRKLELPNEWHYDLQQHATNQGILFVSTPPYREAADFLASLHVPFIKVSSADIDNLPFLRHLATLKIPLLLSTGMAEMVEVETAVELIASAGCPEWGLLHCLSQYPAPHAEANLRALQTLQAAFQCPIGYSDHTQGFETAIASIALGASIIEKHITLDRNLPGPDHIASATPEEFTAYVNAIRLVETALGDGIKKCQPSEVDTKKIARKSISVEKSLPAGHILQPEDMIMLRPASGIEPKYLSDIVGKTLKINIDAGQALEWEMLA